MRQNARLADPGDPGRHFDQRYRRALLSFFSRRVESRAEAEDLTQEVFVRLFRRGDAVIAETMDAYVFQVATNLVRDRHRRGAGTLAWLPSPGVDGSAGRCEAALIEERTPDRVLAGKHDLAAAMRALDELGPRVRDIFLLFRTERMRQKDIAAAFGISVSAVEKIVVKAAAHLARRCGR